MKGNKRILIAVFALSTVGLAACADGGLGPIEPEGPNFAKGGPEPPGSASYIFTMDNTLDIRITDSGGNTPAIGTRGAKKRSETVTLSAGPCCGSNILKFSPQLLLNNWLGDDDGDGIKDGEECFGHIRDNGVEFHGRVTADQKLPLWFDAMGTDGDD